MPPPRARTSAVHAGSDKAPRARAEPAQPKLRAATRSQLATGAPVDGHRGDQWLHEPKWDGYRILAPIVDGKVSLWSRNRIEWTGKLPRSRRR